MLMHFSCSYGVLYLNKRVIRIATGKIYPLGYSACCAVLKKDTPMSFLGFPEKTHIFFLSFFARTRCHYPFLPPPAQMASKWPHFTQFAGFKQCRTDVAVPENIQTCCDSDASKKCVIVTMFLPLHVI